MKALSVMAIITTLFLSGCVSTVTTYDASGNKTGKCTAQKGFFLGANATCSGTANPEAAEK